MATKETEKPAASATTADIEMIKVLLEGMQKNQLELVKSLVEEQRKPSPEALAAKKRAQEHWKIVEEQNRANKELREAMCTHIHEDANKSMFGKMPMSYPQGAWSMVCGRCFKILRNFEDGKLIHNPEFVKWWNTASLTDGVGMTQ